MNSLNAGNQCLSSENNLQKITDFFFVILLFFAKIEAILLGAQIYTILVTTTATSKIEPNNRGPRLLRGDKVRNVYYCSRLSAFYNITDATENFSKFNGGFLHVKSPALVHTYFSVSSRR